MSRTLISGTTSTRRGTIWLEVAAFAPLVVLVMQLSVAARAQEPTAKDSQKEGRIFFSNQGRLASIRPDGKDQKWHSETPTGTDWPLNSRLSPDGKRVAYGIQSKDFQGKGAVPRRLYVRGLAEKDAGNDIGIDGDDWCWSSDGTQLAVVSSKDNKATNWLVDVKTKKQTQLQVADNHRVTDWSPDGKWLLTTSNARGDDKGPKLQIHLVSKDGSESRALTKPEQFAMEGRFSPDGKKVLFMGGNPEKRDVLLLFVVDLAGGKPQQVSQETNVHLMGHCWSPDGKRIAYIWRQRHEKPMPGQETESFLMVVEANGKNPVTVLSEKEQGKEASPLIITIASPDWRVLSQ